MLAVGAGLVPAVIWGIMPVILHYIKGSAFEQLLGTTLGTLIMATLLFMWQRPVIDAATLVLAALSGLAWSVGQVGQYWSYQQLGVSKAFPISTGLQIVGNSLIGGLGLHEWATGAAIGKGVIGVAIIIIGILVGNLILKSTTQAAKSQLKAYIVLILTTIGYWGYSFFPKLIVHENPVAAMLPQALGMVIMALILIKLLRTQPRLNGYRIKLNTLGGLLFGVAAMAYLVSVTLNGMVNAFLLSQLNMVIATLLGVYLLKEPRQVSWWRLYTGLALIIIGGGVIVL
ncbi:GRP family sugar transporter [Lactiplantibacillus mudanjiangensis]|uniref:Sugar transporter [Lactobacillus paracollinoides] n=1 Tax=Lactiplantibacillus mudanjiangensis TaxID=1296538 RepID=A0A660E388_9LACO|nr:GRP family sugar transporter [Lactiplantibacillus mudanjiangensis]VDG24054.1 sugar transporter [Lactobacillus paracollinoides] [Lactiplantibacillus mudanjiangensis]VDG30234.1 sugar transporter [Lactobacillus paracollinoides] [Lactiplantibacillus mudanjiangensis]VDG33848.1 sugar transporter [Lactobacillus paracollinoides] [Lactiplantibacillus mudanjiangensis]